MQSNGDLMRRLAVSFGKGLAFTAAATLVQDAMRPREAASTPVRTAAVAVGPAPDMTPLLDRLNRIEQRLQQTDQLRPKTPLQAAEIDPKVIQVIVGAVEKHLERHASQVQQRIDGLQATILSSVQSSAAGLIAREANALRAQVLIMQREFAGSVAKIVASEVAARTASIESAAQRSVEAAVAPFRAEIQDLRRRISETDHTVGEFVAAISDTVRNAEEQRAFTPQSQGSTWAPEAAPRSSRLDLRQLRKRLSEVDSPPLGIRYPPLPPAPAVQRKTPSPVWQFRAAS